MPRTATAAENTYRCFRCNKTLPATPEHFYFRSNGSIISGCKDCHKQMAEERRADAPDAAKRTAPSTAIARNGTAPSAQLAFGVVENARPAPALVQYRCEGCGRGSMTGNPEGPRGWKRVRLTQGEDPATLCPRCTAAVTRAFQVVQSVNNRRHAGRGRQH